MSQENQITPPPVMWAQRKSLLYVTICLEDCKDPTIKIEPEKVYFKGTGGTERKDHEVTINLYKEIDPEKSVQNAKGRLIELILAKKEEGPYWPRLVKENNKYHWLKSDFNKWKDEDDSDNESDENNPHDLESVMKNMGYLGGGGPGDTRPTLDDLDDMADEADGADSDDDEMPDLE
ncbi:prostaglandin E synthase 3 isoform X1 [Diachasmimorpha longicaudata]|uniref:prostaglandin E synthase 3 isoform X1 n=1 Tax=Diachasmimorpha longicaudata TaxID=58733 RepID=UPI0030B8BCEA